MDSFKEEVYPRFFQFNYTKDDVNNLRFMIQTLPNTLLINTCTFNDENTDIEDNPEDNPEGNNEGNPEDNPEGNNEDNPEGNPEGNPEDNNNIFSKWSLKETALLLSNVDKYGNKWVKMDINGRSVSSIRNRWARLTYKHIKKGKNRCLKCLMIKRGHICNYD